MSKTPITMTPGDDTHLTLLMAPVSLNFVTGQDREHLLAFGRAAFEAGKATAEQGKCLHQIAEPTESSPTAGMNIAQRILHVGGRDNAAGYVEFGSVQAVEALVRQLLRDLPDAVKNIAPTVHPHHCTARTENGACEECELHAQELAELEAELATEKRHQRTRDAAAVKTLKALGYDWNGGETWQATGFTYAAQRRSRIYVAGPMTGLPDFNYPAFNVAALELRTQGWHVENPADHGVIEGAEWADYLAYDLTRLGTCSAIYLLPGWELSKGAVLEHHIAQVLGLEVMFAPNAYKTESYVPLSQRMQLGYTALVEIMRSRTVDKHSKELASQAFWALGDAINVWRTQGIKEIHA